MYISTPGVMAKAINIRTKKMSTMICGEAVDTWMTTIDIIDERGLTNTINVWGKTLESVAPSFDPYNGTERGSDDHPF